jgi:isopentenyl phosphate kinase
MVLKLEFYNRKRNNEAWWNRVWDRVNQTEKRQWVVHGGGPYGDPSVEFTFTYPDGKPINDQLSINQVVWCFVINQINVSKFYLNGKDVTAQLQQR